MQSSTSVVYIPLTAYEKQYHINEMSDDQILESRYLIMANLVAYGLLNELRALFDRLPALIIDDNFALQFAVETDNINAVKVILNCYGNRGRKFLIEFYNGLKHAILSGTIEMINLFILAGADFNFHPPQETPLIVSVLETKRIDVLTLFLKQGASIVDESGMLYQAADYTIEMISLLYTYRPDLFIIRKGELHTSPMRVILKAAASINFVKKFHFVFLLLSFQPNNILSESEPHTRELFIRQKFIASILYMACDSDVFLPLLDYFLQQLPDELISSCMMKSIENSITICSSNKNKSTTALKMILEKYKHSLSYSLLEKSLITVYELNHVEGMKVLLSYYPNTTFILTLVISTRISMLSHIAKRSDNCIILSLFLEHALMNEEITVVTSIIKTGRDLTLYIPNIESISPSKYKRLASSVHAVLIACEDPQFDTNIIGFNENKKLFQKLECELIKKINPTIRRLLSRLLEDQLQLRIAFTMDHPIARLIDHVIERYLSDDNNARLFLDIYIIKKLKGAVDAAKQDKKIFKERKYPSPNLSFPDFMKLMNELEINTLSEARISDINALLAPMTYPDFVRFNTIHKQLCYKLGMKGFFQARDGFLLRHNTVMKQKRQAQNKSTWNPRLLHTRANETKDDPKRSPTPLTR